MPMREGAPGSATAVFIIKDWKCSSLCDAVMEFSTYRPVTKGKGCKLLISVMGQYAVEYNPRFSLTAT